MKIGILSHSKEQPGGVERFCLYLKKVLSERGHVVTILGKEDLSQAESFIMFLSKYIGMTVPVLGYFLGRKAKREKFDVCITNGAFGWNIKNKNLVNVQHSTFARAAERVDKGRNALKFFMKFYIWGFFEGIAARRASVCVAVSEETKISVEKFYHVKNVIVIPNAVDTAVFKQGDKKTSREKFHIPPEQFVAIFVGRFEYAKGKKILEGLQNYLTEKGGRLIVVEKYSQEELLELYTAADIFLLPSLHEGCSYALLDAMSCGLPILASPVGLVYDFQKNNLFPECVVITQTVQSYSEKMEHIVALIKSNSVKDLSGSLRAYIQEHHNIDQFAFQYEKLIKEIITISSGTTQ